MIVMPDISRLEGITRINASGALARGLGHMAHLRGLGVAFGGRLLILGLAATFLFVLAAMAAPFVSDWVRQRFDVPDVTGTAGWGAFLIIGFVLVLVLVFGLARVL